MATDVVAQGYVFGEGTGKLERSDELTQLIRRAAWLGEDDSGHATASFTSLFLAFLASGDALSMWVQDKLAYVGPAPRDILRQWKAQGTWRKQGDLDERRIELARGAEVGGIVVVTTPSADSFLEAARGIAGRVGSDQFDVRHLFAVYLYEPPGHVADLQAWKLDREAWATRFRCYVTAAYPAEADAWRLLHDKMFACATSIGIHELLHWATAIARDASKQTIDAQAVLHGIVLDGITHASEKVTSSQLVACLGGVAAAESWIERPTSNGSSLTTLPYDAESWPIFDRALVFATASRRNRGTRRPAERRLNVRHLVAAFLTDRRPLPAFALLNRAQRTQSGVLAQMRRSIEELEDPNDDLALWARIFDEHREEVFADYDNDEAHGEDRLEIDTDVRALAAVLASAHVAPPLSVGLFGDWGSGKSFFMKRLSERIRQLEAAAKARPEVESWFVGRRGYVVQIDFNAWHYMDADLWSSLAVRVFDALGDRFKAEFAQACARNLSSLKEQQAALEADQKAVTASVGRLEEELKELSRQRETAEITLRQYLDGVVGEIAKDPKVEAASKTLHLEGEAVVVELEGARRDLQTVSGAAVRVWRAWRSPMRLLVLGLVIAIPMIAVLVAGAIDHVAAIVSGALVALASLVAAVEGGHKTAVRLAGIANGALDRVRQIERDARSKKTEQEKETEAKRASLAARAAEIEREKLQLAKRQAELEVELGKLRDPDKRTLQEFILQRAAADDYRKNLGVVSAVHRDFKELSGFLQPDRDGPNVERIILYIDDLDRCSPERVVQVLQAIHVILSLPLFVVVVAVDSRWLLDSLTAYYRQQFPGGAVDTARPQQYLEKIFQIPFTLLPMSPAGYEALSGSLLGRHVDVVEAIEASVTTTGPAATAPVQSSAPVLRTAPRRIAASSRVELTPRGLRLEPGEADYLRKLSGLVASPRATKRLVNLYRIVRSTLDDDALDKLIGGGYRVTQVCLALVVGHPALGAELFDDILSTTLTSRDALVTWCQDHLQALNKIETRQRSAIREVLRHRDEFAHWPSVIAAVRRVARFSFETGRVLGYYVAET